ncbi:MULTISPECIES: ABC transporter substrate-binding protein [Bradyrhizobium]|jgi:branched-chain amino acid transport system substrate-binding protein|uniref:ABC transporter substrate-binding protein n=2 Tax=Pseudomonadota TaxID=1224 RepID=UPI0003F70ED5|nr:MULTISPECIES: ABC transporter substrate-binding protein [Bradyrhizobium]KIU46787.1 branched-chain amino acid ABC transporter substrate-binding protein [Bradyrhizobium elkanii]MBK5656445.1 ABC transporter substrate-binding protein [Rhizobium sp.]OCX29626.1 branched-chain amino acid ABC transporter substrate-binding protein [Bradyrhizobium sp. UASWS1016]
MSATRHLAAFAVALALVSASCSTALAQKKYDTGASDTEIKIGNIMPYSGPASAYGVIGKTEEAYFRKINAEGGINGRKITFISYDDAYTPPKTVEQARKLVESDEVLLIFNPLGTPPNSAIQKYMNTKKVPQLFVATGATKWNDPKEFPWTMGWQPNYQSETQIYAKYILKNHPNAKIAVLYQNDDYGKDYLKGFKDGLGAKGASLIVAEDTYEVTEPTIDSHIVTLKASGADVFMNITTPKFAAQAIKKNAELGWKPLHFLNNVSASIGSVIAPAGKENAQGIISSAYLKDPTDPQWTTDPAMIAWNKFLDQYYPDANRADASVMYAYTVAQGLVHVLKACGDDLTRANIMKQAASIQNLELGGLLPGIKVNTSATDFAPLSQLQLERFKGETWERFGDILSSDVGG